MPASPRATVVGVGAAVLIVFGIFLAPIAVLTGYFGSISQRESVVRQTTAVIESQREYGVSEDAIRPPEPVLMDGADVVLYPVTGEATAFTQLDIPLHRQPRELLVYVGGTDANRTSLSAADLLSEDSADRFRTIEEVIGGGSIGIPVAFADGTVWMLQPTTPCRELAPFLRRDTMALAKRENQLRPFRMRDMR